jgi:hypothetical protein
MGRANPPSGKPRGQWRVAAVSPLDLLPSIGGKLQSQGLGRDRLMRLVAAQPLAGSGRGLSRAPAATAGGNDASPGHQTIVVGRMPAT